MGEKTYEEISCNVLICLKCKKKKKKRSFLNNCMTVEIWFNTLMMMSALFLESRKHWSESKCNLVYHTKMAGQGINWSFKSQSVISVFVRIYICFLSLYF